MDALLHGHLHLFLGYASGVGKTHTMLNAALQQQKQGHDVAIAQVKTFANAGYIEFANQLEHIPAVRSTGHAVDVAAVLQRKPHIVVIDDLHECNPPGFEFHRRYQEVQVILEAGISVHTTLTVFYLESLSDIVEKLTGIRFEKTVPDRLIAQATTLELVDVPVETVMQRLKHETIAPQEPLQGDLHFNEQTLTPLRQLALRQASHWVEAHSRAKQQARATDEHLMVCISASPLSSKLIRAAYQLARELNAQWTAVYVETSQAANKDDDSHSRLIQNMHLVEKLGGKVVTIHGNAIPETLMRYAREHDISKLVIGYPTQSRWYRFWHKSIIDRLVQQNSNMDIYVISSGQPAETFVEFVSPGRPLQWKKYLLTVAIISATTLLDIFINPFVFPATLVTVYLLGIAAAAVYLGYRPALIATLLSVMSFFFFLIPPTVDTTVESLRYLVILVGLLVAGVILTRFITGAMERANNASRHADQMMELYALSRDLSTTIAFEGIIETMVTHVKHTFQAEASIYLNHDEHLEPYHSTAGFFTGTIEALAAHKAHETGQSTGAGTLSQSEATAIYIPLRTAHKKVGVMGIAFTDQKALSLDQHRLLDAFANQAALVIEASRLVEQAHQVRLAREREKLQAALLDSISHDIRTPLVAITGALSSLRDEAALFDAQMRIELLDDAWSEAERLNSLVENLLEMSRLQSGELTLNRDWHSLDEIIGVARSQMRERLRDYRIITHIQPDVSLIHVDFSLLVQVLVNLLDNAAKYSTETKIIEICTMTQNDSVVFQVADQGSGIPELELPHIFNKFYRASNVTNVNGTGLGLSICAGIVEAHGGSIHAFNRPEGGALFEIRLPMKGGEL